MQPSLVDAHRELAREAKKSGDWATVAAELQAALAWEPGDTAARDDLAEALKKRP
jgi:alkyl sulfatase BDS1-like metallo-beta-lactamase superfamily hydrolase